MGAFLPALNTGNITPEMIDKYAQSNPQLAQMLQTRYNSAQFLNQQSPEDQASIRASWTGTPQIGRNSQQDQWYNNAVQAGSAPANTRPAVQPQAAPAWPGQSGATGNPFVGGSYTPAAAPAAPATQAPAQNNNLAAPAAAIAGGVPTMLANNFGIMGQKPAPMAKMSYDDAKAKYGRERAMAGQASGEFGS